MKDGTSFFCEAGMRKSEGSFNGARGHGLVSDLLFAFATSKTYFVGQNFNYFLIT